MEIVGRHQRRRARSATALASALAAVALVSCTTPKRVETVDAVLSRSIVVDTHIDAPFRIEREHADLSRRADDGQFDLVRAREGHLGAAFMSIFVPASEDEAGRGVALADRLVDHVEALAASAPMLASVATCVDDVRRDAAAGRIALALGMENGGPLASRADALEHFYARGVRYVTLAHAKSNAYADSSYDVEQRWQGLSPAGRALVADLNARGIMVDVSHVSEKAFWQIVSASAVPVIASHSSARHFTPDFERNLSDEMIRAIAERGGVVQVNFGSGFVSQPAREWEGRRNEAFKRFIAETAAKPDSPQARKFLTDYVARYPYPRATIDTVLDHIDYVAKLVGVEHVGLGSDFEGVGDTLPSGLEDVSTYPNVAHGLIARGYSGAQIRLILGENLLRVWSEVERYAADHAHPPMCRGAGSAPAAQ